MSASVLGVLANPFRSTSARRPQGPESRSSATVPARTANDVDRELEHELIRAAQAGSRNAFDSLVLQYDQAVLRLALHVSGSETDAQDIVQEAFLKAYRYIGNFRFECSFYTWLYRIVTNVSLDLMRRRKTRREDPALITDSASGETIDLLGNISDDRSMANPARELERKEMGARIGEALEKLTPRERMVFEMKHHQGMRLRAIGEALNTTEETAKNTLFRATRKLRAELAPIHGSAARGEAL